MRTAAAVGGQKAAFNRLTEHNIQPYRGHTHTLNPIDSLQQSHTRPSMPHFPRGCRTVAQDHRRPLQLEGRKA